MIKYYGSTVWEYGIPLDQCRQVGQMAGSHEDAGRRGERLRGEDRVMRALWTDTWAVVWLPGQARLVGLVWGAKRCITAYILMQPTGGSNTKARENTMHALLRYRCTGLIVGAGPRESCQAPLSCCKPNAACFTRMKNSSLINLLFFLT